MPSKAKEESPGAARSTGGPGVVTPPEAGDAASAEDTSPAASPPPAIVAGPEQADVGGYRPEDASMLPETPLPPPPPPPPASGLGGPNTFARPVLDDHLMTAVGTNENEALANDPGVAREAALIPAMQRMRVAFDQLSGVASTDMATSGTVSEATQNHARQVMAPLERDRLILRAAHEAAESYFQEMNQKLDQSGGMKAMSAQDPNDPNKDPNAPERPQPPGPQLTDTGVPHPLQQGGYDPNADAQLPSNESDVGALKAGHGTRKMTEAQNAARQAQQDANQGDVPNNQGQTSQSQPPSPPPAPTGEAGPVGTSAPDDLARTNPAAQQPGDLNKGKGGSPKK
jgi:hypothetical protein